jgi:tetratricopeptide (TPR) repeat protein
MLGFATETTTDTDKSLDSFTEFKEGVEFLKNDYPQKALVKLQSAFESDKHNPYYISFLGVSIARAQRNWAKASELCEMAVQLNPKEIQFHLNLAEVYSLAGRREMSLHKLDYALGLFGDDPRLILAKHRTPKFRQAVAREFERLLQEGVPAAVMPEDAERFVKGESECTSITWDCGADSTAGFVSRFVP